MQDLQVRRVGPRLDRQRVQAAAGPALFIRAAHSAARPGTAAQGKSGDGGGVPAGRRVRRAARRRWAPARSIRLAR